jgi:plasmid stabilization system protein ParE
VKHYRVRYLNEAKAALREATAYLVDNAGPGRAQDWLRNMREGIDKLETLPLAFPRATIQDGRAIHAKLISPYHVY